MEIIDISGSLSAEELPEYKTFEKCKTYTIEGVAWVGSGLILTAYIYPLDLETDFMFNLVGAASLLGVCLKKKAFQPMVLNTALIIGGFYKYFKTS